MFKKTFCFILTALGLFSGAAFGDEPRELMMVRKQYIHEIKPISDRYLNNLDMMKRRFEQKCDKASMDAVLAEKALVEKYLDRENLLAGGELEERSAGSIAGKCMFFYAPDRSWFKIMYFRPDGTILGANNPNEMRWEQKDYNLLLMDEKGQITGTYKYIKQDDGRLYFENGSGDTVYVILEEPKG